MIEATRDKEVLLSGTKERIKSDFGIICNKLVERDIMTADEVREYARFSTLSEYDRKKEMLDGLRELQDIVNKAFKEDLCEF